ncbi:hypothetical protein [Thalassotalea sp. ND16A]|nr:hypothetical protein [Thalassotalea sp. ND16A]
MFDGISYHYLDENRKFTALHKALASAFPGQDINISANSVDAVQ